MSQPEEASVVPAADVQVPESNGKDNRDQVRADYVALQKMIHFEVERIETFLLEYYAKNFAEYFPDQKKRALFEWNITRTDGKSDMQVNFKVINPDHATGNGLAQAEKVVAAAPAKPPTPTPAPSPVKPPVPAPSTGIYTTDEVGTPPSGPTPPDPTQGK